MARPTSSLVSSTSSLSSSSSSSSSATCSPQIDGRNKLPAKRGPVRAGQSIDKRKRLAANARERKRMHLLNKAYDQLRRRLVDADNKSKYDVLIQAKEYIQALAKICDNFDKQNPDHPSAINSIRNVEYSRYNEEDDDNDDISETKMRDQITPVTTTMTMTMTTPTPTPITPPQLDDYDDSHFIVSNAYQQKQLQQPLQSPLSSSSDCTSPMSLPDSVSSTCSSQHSNIHPYYSLSIQVNQQQLQHQYHQQQQVTENLARMSSIASINEVLLRAKIKTEPTLLMDHNHHHQYQLLGPNQHLYDNQYHQFYYSQKATL